MGQVVRSSKEEYKELLRNYIETQDEHSLYGVEMLSKSLLKNNIPPEEIVNIHIQALEEIYPNLSQSIKHSMKFLLEAMISYGIKQQEIETLREQQYVIKSEIAIAASMQETLLKTDIPSNPSVDIGVISVPANQMNGDYYHFVKGLDDTIGFAIADIIGKGIPAALCMSMIKYALDSYPEDLLEPSIILHKLNRVVERNVDPNMFMTMIYAQYSPKNGKLRFSSAGHEPGFYYSSQENKFHELTTKGLALGILSDVDYEEYELKMKSGDMVIFVTDGVTEVKKNGYFIETKELLDFILKHKDYSSQEIVECVFKYFQELQNYRLSDDFTMIILKKVV